MPTVDLPGMRSISTDSACIARHRSSARLVIFEYFTPASGLNSYVVTTGPGGICTTLPSTEDSRDFSSVSRALVRHEIGRQRPFFRVLGDHVAPLLLAAALLAPRAERLERARRALRRHVQHDTEEAAERKMGRQDDRQEDQRDDHDDRAGA